MMTIDNPLVRRLHTCPLCEGSKDSGLILCWPCHRKQKMQNHGAYSPETEARIARLERYLERLVKDYSDAAQGE